MDVSNSTGEDTHYRTGSGTTKALEWTALPLKGSLHCADPKGSWTIYFQLHDGKILSATYTEPQVSVALVKNGGRYKITAVKKTVRDTVKPTKRKNAA